MNTFYSGCLLENQFSLGRGMEKIQFLMQAVQST